MNDPGIVREVEDGLKKQQAWHRDLPEKLKQNPKNGSEASGDGWTYRGRGLKQLTGRGNYREFTDKYRSCFDEEPIKNFENNPGAVLESMKDIVRSVIFFWLTRNLYSIADKGATDEVVKVCMKVNGGTNGLAVRQQAFRDAWEAKVFEGIAN